MAYRTISPVPGYELVAALRDRGIIPDGCQRVVIEIDADSMVKIHYQVIGERNLLEVVPAIAVPATVAPERGIWPAPTTTEVP